MTTLEKVLQLIDREKAKTNLSDIALDKAIGLKRSSIANWRLGRGTPSSDALTKIADYFHVSVDYLLGRTDNPNFNSELKLPNNLMPEEVVMFPVIGMIAAGYDGNVSFDPTGDEIPVPEYLLKTHNPNDYFVLQVIGNSMLPTYHNGDKVLIRKTDSVDSGTIAAVGFDTENATLKKVEYAKGENWMKLIPLNPDFPVKEIKGADLDLCHIYGEVVCKFDNQMRATDGGRFAEQFNNLSEEQQQTIMQLMKSMLN